MTIQVSRFTVCTFFCSVLLCGFLNIEAYKAVVIAPVADLIGEYSKEGASVYQHIPVSGGKGPIADTCKREHQLLYNEMVEVVEEQHEQVRVGIPGLICSSREEQPTFWMLKKNLYPLLTDKDEDLLAHLPEPLRFRRLMQQQSNTVALTLPYRDTEVNTTYSVGTRFVVESLHEEQQLVTVYRLDKDTHCCTTMSVPKEHCLFPVGGKELQRKNFVELVRLWAHNPQGASPYVWGGGSLTFSSSDLRFKEVETENGCSYYAIQNAAGLQKIEFDGVKTGFDCSGLILRAAQAAGLPYFYRNTSTLASYLSCIGIDKHLQDGDLIWIPGHVMIVSDCEHGLVVEARGYDSGWGRLHEVGLKELFKDIETCADLEKIFRDKQPLLRLDKAGRIVRTYETFKLLALDSVWDQKELLSNAQA